MSERIILAAERRRRTIAVVVAVLLAVVYFYEYPLYALLYLYDKYQGLGGLDSAPGFSGRDGLFVLLCAAGLLFVYMRPMHFIEARQGGQRFAVFRKGREERSIASSALAHLEIKHYSVRRSPSKSSGFIDSIKIASVSEPDIVFFDAASAGNWGRVRQIARMLERRLGEVKWKDKTGIYTGEVDVKREARLERREAQLEELARKARHTPPKVVKAYGMRVFMVAVFAAFGAAFWIGGYPVVGGVFGGLAALIAVDMIAAMLGFGQQPDKK